MRKKVIEYLKKPTAKARAELTTMERKWCADQIKGEAKQDEKKPKK